MPSSPPSSERFTGLPSTGSSRKVAYMHWALPLNVQERRMRRLLERSRISYWGHAVFPVAFNGVNRTMIVDAFLPGPRLVIECWTSESSRSSALAWVRNNAAAIDVRFARLKERDASLRCLGLVEANEVEREELAAAVGPVMGHADHMAYSMEELGVTLKVLMAATTAE